MLKRPCPAPARSPLTNECCIVHAAVVHPLSVPRPALDKPPEPHHSRGTAAQVRTDTHGSPAPTTFPVTAGSRRRRSLSKTS
jgi:hypothetical protein